MNIEFQELLPTDFDERSRVWIYQSNRKFTLHEALQIEDILKTFITGWNAHGTGIKGYANLFFGQFVVLVADETHYGVSGCSTDSSVRMIHTIEQTFEVSLFDRLLLAFIVKEKVQTIPMAQLNYALENGFIDSSTLYFNNTVTSLDGLKSNWLIPVKDSWLGKDKRYSELIARKTLTHD